MTAITPEIRQAIEQVGQQPVELTDPRTHSVYIIVRADVYGRHRALFDESHIQNASPLIDQVAARDGWDDPATEVYGWPQPRCSAQGPDWPPPRMGKEKNGGEWRVFRAWFKVG